MNVGELSCVCIFVWYDEGDIKEEFDVGCSLAEEEEDEGCMGERELSLKNS